MGGLCGTASKRRQTPPLFVILAPSSSSSGLLHHPGHHHQPGLFRNGQTLFLTPNHLHRPLSSCVIPGHHRQPRPFSRPSGVRHHLRRSPSRPHPSSSSGLTRRSMPEHCSPATLRDKAHRPAHSAAACDLPFAGRSTLLSSVLRRAVRIASSRSALTIFWPVRSVT